MPSWRRCSKPIANIIRWSWASKIFGSPLLKRLVFIWMKMPRDIDNWWLLTKARRPWPYRSIVSEFPILLDRKVGNKSVPGIDWSAAVGLMGQLIRADMKTDLTTILTAAYSNTTPVEQAVFDCTLMDSVKSYYEYKFSSLLWHSASDPFVEHRQIFNWWSIEWINLRSIFTDFHWWLDALVPHLRELKASAEGKPNLDWWQKICHRVGGGSDVSMLAGWLADFVP